MFVCCECRVLSGRGLCDELIIGPEESYRLCCVVLCDLENLKNEEAMTRVELQCHSTHTQKKNAGTHTKYRNFTPTCGLYNMYDPYEIQ